MKPNRQYFDVELVNGRYEQDLLSPYVPKFKEYITRPVSYAIFKPEYAGNLDAMSYKIYGTEHLWWAIAYANDIICPFASDLVGVLLKLPNILDINDFYNDNYQTYSDYE